MRSLLLLLALAGCAAASDVFFYNTVTGATQWERPHEMPFRDEEGRPYWEVDGEARWVPPTDWAWQEAHDPEGNEYYHNTITGESAWSKPASAGWTARSADRYFFHNTVTGETTRERPHVMGHESEEHNATYYVSASGEPTWHKPPAAAWSKATDKETGREYFSNDVTGEVVWLPPADSNVAWQKWHEEVPHSHK
jgi:hypothetical protein